MELFRKIRKCEVNAYITASAVTDLFYIIRKNTHDTEQTYMIMENIFKLVTVFAVTEKDIQDAFQKKWRDFEDCVQYMTVAGYIESWGRGFRKFVMPAKILERKT